ncbi:MAG TPA: DEAD/DEAH box helicase, partial [Spirochaetota bacterium]|nr:DEAD/DEAH box helicase [Spirochaetota bacterium]
MTFEDLHLIAPILKALQTEGYTAPTPIQQQAIPVILGR